MEALVLIIFLLWYNGTAMTPEEAKIALDVGYFLLLGYVLRRLFNLADSFTNRVESKLDQLLTALSEKGKKS